MSSLLYTSHFLSTWNSRAFEFGAFLFLATIYPQTLLPASVYALARAAAGGIFSPWIGEYIDKAERLPVIRISIVGQRLAVAVSCLLLFILTRYANAFGDGFWQYGALAVLSMLACVEKLSAVMNTVAVERDWVVIMARGDEVVLATMNSRIRRIDLFCKLIAPLFVSLIDAASTSTAIIVLGVMTATSLPVEYFAIARVYHAVSDLQSPKQQDHTDTRPSSSFASSITKAVSSVLVYITHPIFLPSFSLALLYLTVLSFNGQLITYLLALDFPSFSIGILRGISALFELSATWLAPMVMSRLGPIRSGIWFINYQIACVTLACLFFWLPTTQTIPPDATPSPTASFPSTWVWALAAVTAVMFSRIGLWGFDLSVAILVQEAVEPELRGTISSYEVAAQNFFEMLAYASTVVFARPEEFRIPAAISAGAVGMAGVLYATFVRLRRGHLVHLSQCIERKGKGRSDERGEWELLPTPRDDEEDLEE